MKAKELKSGDRFQLTGYPRIYEVQAAVLIPRTPAEEKRNRPNLQILLASRSDLLIHPEDEVTLLPKKDLVKTEDPKK